METFFVPGLGADDNHEDVICEHHDGYHIRYFYCRCSCRRTYVYHFEACLVTHNYSFR